MSLLKEALIYIARFLIGEAKTHDYLIRRGLRVRHLSKYYNKSQNTNVPEEISRCSKKKQTLVYMADGKWMHGGLTDRLRGMVSAWKFAKEHDLNFKIFHSSPIFLEKIFAPAKIDWPISEKDLQWDSSFSKPVLLYREDFENTHVLERQLDSWHKQFHLYSCIDSVGDEFPDLFNELFTPSDMLLNELDKYRNLHPKSYGAISFRMQNLLGDFPEGKFGELSSDKDKESLMTSAIKALNHVIQEHPEWEKVLVTADSPKLLAQASKLSKVVTVSGKSVHIDFNNSKTEQDYLKAFVEFILISKAEKAFLYCNRKFKTYPSNFPKYAAKLGNIPFELIET